LPRFAQILRFALVLGCSLQGAAARAEEPEPESVREAKILFQVILAKEPAPERCEFTTTWPTDTIPEEVARKHFGLAVHASLAAPFWVVQLHPEEILDPDKRNADAFCSPDQVKANLDQKLKALETASIKSVWIKDTGYAFPIFDMAYRKAIVVVSDGSCDWHSTPAGAKRYCFLSVYAKMYRKIKGTWRETGSEQLGIT
jgi:hypothetical protein